MCLNSCQEGKAFHQFLNLRDIHSQRHLFCLKDLLKTSKDLLTIQRIFKDLSENSQTLKEFKDH